MTFRLRALSFVLISSLGVVSLIAPACSDKCSNAGSCDRGEVCYRGVCTDLSAEYVSCDSNLDCGDDGQFLCRAGHCTLKPSTMTPDSGVTRDSGVPNSGGSSDGSIGVPDSGGGSSDGSIGIPDSGGGGPDSGPRPDSGIVQNGVTAVVRGVLIQYPNAEAYLATQTMALTITATSASGEVLRLSLARPQNNMSGTCLQGLASIRYRVSTGEQYAAQSTQDTCSIGLSYGFTQVNSVLRGTFSGTLREVGGNRTLDVSNGIFDLVRGLDR